MQDRWGNEQDVFTRAIGKKDFLFISPHQDDELISFGTPIAELSIRGAGDRTHVLLATDGSASFVSTLLANERECELHEGHHVYELDSQEFSAARDREFIESCEMLGVPAQNIYISDRRTVDGELSTREAREIISDYTRKLPGAVVCVIGPSKDGFEKTVQHPDHTRLGQAAVELHREGKIRELLLFIEPSGVLNFRVNHPATPLTRLIASPKAAAMIEGANIAYSRWDPENGRYAVGLHSVRRIVEKAVSQPVAYFYLPKNWSESVKSFLQNFKRK